MVKALSLFAAIGITAMSGCDIDQYEKPIALTPHGTAVRANMAAQIIDPNPPAKTAIATDGAKVALGIEAYRAGEVKDPTAQSTAPDTTKIEEVN